MHSSLLPRVFSSLLFRSPRWTTARPPDSPATSVRPGGFPGRAARSARLQRSGAPPAAGRPERPASAVAGASVTRSIDLLDPSADISGPIADETLLSLPVTAP